MKQFKKSILALTICSVISFPSKAADWVEDYVDNMVVESSSSFKTGNRTFFSAGGFSMRSKTKKDYPLTISKPKLKAGCGGIDGFLGGFSFLDPKYLVDKVQRMGQSAPYIAVDMAMKTMSKELSDTLSKAENMIDALNNIQLDECALATPLVATGFGESTDGVGKAFSKAFNTEEIKKAGSAFWTEANEKTKANNGEATSDLTKLIEGCSKEVKDLFKPDTFILDNLAAKVDMDYAELMRGFFGDVKLTKKEKLFEAEIISACPQNESSSTGFLYGGAYKKTSSLECKPSGGKSIYEVIDKKLGVIKNKLETTTASFTTDEKAFLASSRIPVLQIMLTALENNTLDRDVEQITEIVAIDYAIVITQQFNSTVTQLIKDAQTVSKKKGTDTKTQTKTCDMSVIAPAIEEINTLKNNVQTRKDEMIEELRFKVTSFSPAKEFTSQFQNIYESNMMQHKINTGG